MEKRIRIGHIGTKHDHSLGKLACVLKFPEIFEAVGIVEEDEEQRRAIEHMVPYKGIPFMTEEQLFNAGVDAVLVEGFEDDLPFVANRCVRNGIAVHIDKPGGHDLPEFTDMLKTAKQHHIPVQMAYMYRYNPAVLDCLKKVREGRLGEIHSVYGIMNTGHSTEKRQWLDRFGQGGIMFFLGCHMVDLVHMFQGVPENIVPFLKCSGINGTTSVDQATTIFEYEHGTSYVQSNACEINGYGRRQLVVCGSRGTYETHPLECPIQVKYTEESWSHCYEDHHRKLDIQTVARDARYDDMMLDFAAMVRRQKENPFSYEYELDTQRMLLASCGYDVDFRSKTIL